MLNVEVDFSCHDSVSQDSWKDLNSPIFSSVPMVKSQLVIHDDSEDPDEYVVEKIVSRRKRNGKTEYCVKWANWPESFNSWEPEENLSCPEILDEFNKERDAKRIEGIKRGAQKRAERRSRGLREKSGRTRWLRSDKSEPLKKDCEKCGNTSLTAARRLMPLVDRILVQKLMPGDKAKDEIMFPDVKVNSATVVAVGPGRRTERGALIPPSVKEGDQVLLPDYGGQKIEIDEKEYYFYRDGDILGKWV